MSELLQAPAEGYGDAIVIPAILAEDFELKVGLLQLVTSSQFHGFETDDPHAHISWFNKITSMLKYKNVPHDAIKLMLFYFLSRGQPGLGKKKPPHSIHTWEDLISKHGRVGLDQVVNTLASGDRGQGFDPYPLQGRSSFSTFGRTRNSLSTFGRGRAIYVSTSFMQCGRREALDRFKDLLRKYPHHGFLELHQIDTFYNSLTQSDQDSLNAAAGGNLLNRTPRDDLTIIKNKLKIRTSRNKPVVSKVNTTTSSSSPSPDITALTDIVKELVLMNKANQPAFVKSHRRDLCDLWWFASIL
nr:reverse transcriptase domain-containing protein [Tanacetum cinerariifolium]